MVERTHLSRRIAARSTRRSVAPGKLVDMFAITQDEPGGVETMQWREVPTPTPGDGEVLVRTIAAGVNRADLLQRQGHYPPPPGISDVMGLEASGVVAAVGAGVSRWQPGDEVVALLSGGGYAEYFVVPAGQLAARPAGVDLVDAAALIEVAATVVSNLNEAALKAGETFLVHGGAGGIGSFAVPYAKQLGARVLATSSTAKLGYVRERGADEVIDYHEDWAARVKELTQGRGVDVILDIIGAKYLEANVEALAPDGRLVIIGMQKGTKGTLNISELLNKRGTVRATSLRLRPAEQKAAIVWQVASQVWPLYADGSLQLPPVKRFAMQDAAAAHAWLESGDSQGKAVLTVG